MTSVQGDLTDRAPAPAVATVPPGPATDVCGYDDHMRSFAKRVPTGVAAFILGVVGLVLFEEGTALRGLFNSSMAASWGELLGLAALFSGVLVGIGILVSAGMEHSAFVKAHPFIEDFYTDDDRLQARQVLVRGLVTGLMLIMMGVLLGNFIEHESGAEAPAGAALLALVAVGVWLIVHAGMMYGRVDIDEYNRDAVEELEVEDIARIDVPEAVRNELRSAKRTHEKIEAACGVIMLVSTIVALSWLFLGPSFAGTTWDAIGSGRQAADSIVRLPFWLPLANWRHSLRHRQHSHEGLRKGPLSSWNFTSACSQFEVFGCGHLRVRITSARRRPKALILDARDADFGRCCL